ncbi:hypothetical protein RBSWK_03225 [Rhodopirellula baltica SWK14]|uniref:Uncharacterized protein n=1 Tax=Rhodopirellula baltica SWK14 TaxID=993516 RepID=L7CFG0_RHOBT|nr:hypothetical protein RBSWK_03225 [Rhodopirellula baltica SWK14]
MCNGSLSEDNFGRNEEMQTLDQLQLNGMECLSYDRSPLFAMRLNGQTSTPIRTTNQNFRREDTESLQATDGGRW